jgi:hypothetical protein
MAAPRGKKKRAPKPARTSTTPSSGGLLTSAQAVERFGADTRIPLRGNTEVLDSLLRYPEPDALVETLVPFLWAGIGEGIPANICVDACLTLQQAYAQFGIASTVRVVDLVLKQASGRRRQYGSSTPSWSGPDNRVFDGHAVLALPGSGRFVDATVEQFEPVRRLNMGPLVGRTVATSMPAASPQSALAPGAMFGVKRGGLMLMYTIAAEEYSAQIQAYASAPELAAGHYKAGLNLATLTLEALRHPEVIERARKSPHPRVRALLDAVGDAEVGGTGADIHFMLPGPDGVPAPVMIDQIAV